MADKVTATKKASTTTETTDNKAKINDLLQQVQDLMVEDGQDVGTAEALTNFARSGEPAIVGNLADLQRLGAIAVTGEIPANAMPTGDQGVIETTNIEDAFAEPAKAEPTKAAADFAEVSAKAEKAEEK